MPYDEYGEYEEDCGSPHPVDPENYDACNAVLKHTWSRYGERRYCTGLAISNFGGEANYEHPEFCKHHQQRKELMKQHEDNLKTGAHAKSHEHQFQHLPPHKKLMANDLYRSLISESSYDFDTEMVEMEVSVADSDFAGPEIDTLVLDHPIPTDHEIRGKALWFAALDFIAIESIKQEQFRVAAEETHRGRDLAIGERTKIVTVTDDGREVTDTDEHHLNLPLSRLQSDYSEHMEFGGVSSDTEDDAASVGNREWVARISAEPSPQPEADTGESPPVAELDVPDEDSGG